MGHYSKKYIGVCFFMVILLILGFREQHHHYDEDLVSSSAPPKRVPDKNSRNFAKPLEDFSTGDRILVPGAEVYNEREGNNHVVVVLEEQEDDELNIKDARRRLSLSSSKIGEFRPLECNNNLDSAPCDTLVSNTNIRNTVPYVVPCGKCYLFDLPDGEAHDFPAGINIKGKLKFPRNKKVTIRTPFVIVQGEVSEIASIIPSSHLCAFCISIFAKLHT